MKILKHIINTLDREDNKLDIEIKLHGIEYPYFSLTGTCYEKNKPKIDSSIIYCGCIHKEILEARPDLRTFAALHLSNSKGVPMYAVENGYYFLKEHGYDSKIFMDHMRIDLETASLFKDCKDINHFQYILYKSGILYNWEFQAMVCIRILENWTGETFEDWGENGQVFLKDFDIDNVTRLFTEGVYNNTSE